MKIWTVTYNDDGGSPSSDVFVTANAAYTAQREWLLGYEYTYPNINFTQTNEEIFDALTQETGFMDSCTIKEHSLPTYTKEPVVPLNHYYVEWHIDIEASSPEEAASKALAIQRNNDSMNLVTVFDCIDEDGNIHPVDLTALTEERESMSTLEEHEIEQARITEECESGECEHTECRDDTISAVPEQILEAYRKWATIENHDDGVLEIDEGAQVNVSDDGGAYVQAWIWVSDDEANVCGSCRQELTNNGEGYNAICGSCADKAESEDMQDPLKPRRLKHVCAECGADELVYTGSLYFNSDTQEFELNDVYDDDPACNSDECMGNEVNVHFMDLDSGEQVEGVYGHNDILFQYLPIAEAKAIQEERSRQWREEREKAKEQQPKPWEPNSPNNEHKRYMFLDWYRAVGEGMTRQSYVEWVNSQLSLNE